MTVTCKNITSALYLLEYKSIKNILILYRSDIIIGKGFALIEQNGKILKIVQDKKYRIWNRKFNKHRSFCVASMELIKVNH